MASLQFPRRCGRSPGASILCLAGYENQAVRTCGLVEVFDPIRRCVGRHTLVRGKAQSPRIRLSCRPLSPPSPLLEMPTTKGGPPGELARMHGFIFVRANLAESANVVETFRNFRPTRVMHLAAHTGVLLSHQSVCVLVPIATWLLRHPRGLKKAACQPQNSRSCSAIAAVRP
jgi:hypothetical protein